VRAGRYGRDGTIWTGGARGTPGEARESGPMRGNAVRCTSERRRKALMSRKCGSTCTEGAAVHRVSTEYSARCVRRAWESTRARRGRRGSTEHRESGVGLLSGKCAKAVI
jgi:hypothetical protein